MGGILTVLILIACAALILFVLVQNPKGGGLSSDFGAAHQLGGVKKTTDFIEKATWILAAAIMVFSISLTVTTKPKVEKQVVPTETEQPAGTPAPQGGN